MFLGLYSKKEVISIKLDAFYEGKEEGIRQTRAEMKREINKKDNEIHDLKNINRVTVESCEQLLNNKNKYILDIIEENKEKIKELKTLLALSTDKEIERIEKIKQRTKKIRVKKKCESRIIDYQMKKIDYDTIK